MSGTLTQLAAKGAQDRNLTVQPEITFFKGVWKHHTNFAIEAIEQDFTSGNPTTGTTATAEIPRSGDLVTDIWVKIELAAILNVGYAPFPENAPYMVTYVDEVGHALLKKVKVEIGGHQFDAHNSEYLHMWHELTKKAGRDTDRMIGKFSNFMDRVAASSEHQTLYVPLRFWFNETTSQALPLVALMYHQVKISVEFRSKDEIITSTPAFRAMGHSAPVFVAATDAPLGWPEVYDVQDKKTAAVDFSTGSGGGFGKGEALAPISVTNRGTAPTSGAGYMLDTGSDSPIISCKLLINYVFLDSVERKLFATMEHNYLIDVVQLDQPVYNADAVTNSMSLMLNHPVKELIWAMRPEGSIAASLTKPSTTTAIQLGARGTQRWSGSLNHTIAGIENVASSFPNVNGLVKNFFNFSGSNVYNGEYHNFDTASLKLNGHTRFEDVKAPFFNTIMPAKYHSSTPKSYIYVYPFALDPEDWKPTGSINMSRIDTVKLELKKSDIGKIGAPGGEMFVFARSLNIMKITSGMAGLKYAN